MSRLLRWLLRLGAALLSLVLLAVLGAWWWAGQEGSLDWALQRVARGQPLEVEGATGALRQAGRVARLAWAQDGLRVEAREVALGWEPFDLLRGRVRLDHLHVGSLQVVDQRPDTGEPLKLPQKIVLPVEVAVDSVSVGKLHYAGTAGVELAQIAGAYAYDGMHHDLRLDGLRFADGSYRGRASLGAHAPLPLEASVSARFTAPVPGGKEALPLVLAAKASGPLADFQAEGSLGLAPGTRHAGPAPGATAKARIMPVAPLPVPSGEAVLSQLDLALLWPQAPRTLLGGRIEAQPQADGSVRLQADLRNGAAGRWDAGRLPVEGLQAEGDWRDGHALVRELQARAGGGTLEGKGGWKGPEAGWTFEGRIDGVDPAALHGALAPVRLGGTVDLAGRGEAVDFKAVLQASGTPANASAPAARASSAPAKAQRPPPGRGDGLVAAAGRIAWRDLQARGRWDAGKLSLLELLLRTRDAELSGRLEVELPKRAGTGALRLQAPGLRASVDGELAETRGRGQLAVDVPQVGVARRWLAQWPGMGGLLDDVPQGGSASAQLSWQGGWRDPAVQGRIEAAGVPLGAPSSVAAATRAPAVAGQPAAGTGSQAAAAAGGAPDAATGGLPAAPQAAAWHLRKLTATVDGRLRDARLDLQAQAEQGQRRVELRAAGRGGRSGTTWRGELASFGAQVREPALTPGAWELALRRPVAWSFAPGRLEVAGGEALLHAPALPSGAPATDAVLTWTPLRRQGGELFTAGRLAGLPMSWIELLGGPQLAGSALAGDMVFDAQWDAQLGRSVRVDASLARVRGDAVVLAENAEGGATRVAAGVRDARLTLRSQGEQLTLGLVWDSERAGNARGEVATRLVREGEGWRLPPAAPLAGRLRAQLPRLGVWSLLAPPGWRLRGALSADITVGGTLAEPLLNGPLAADELALRSVVDGIELRNGRLRARLAGRRLVVDEFLLHGADDKGAGGGTLAAHGEGGWTREGVQLQASVVLTRLRASIRDDRELTVSGPLQARVDGSGTSVGGKLTFDRARVRIPDETPPRLGDDVVVRNAPGLAATEGERRQRPAPGTGGPAVSVAVTVDLGDDFRIGGRGIDTRVAGTLQLEGKSLGLPRLVGVVRTVDGRYEGYGQRMEIERGEIRFTGQADNPALDILAIRPNLTQRVGVTITGRAQSPHVELYSDGGLSEAETLSWLVLGRSSAGGGAEAALLQRAAAALLANRRGGSGRGLAASFGLDDLTVRNDSTAGGAVLRLGKRFAGNFYAAYERSLSGAMGTLYIFYDVSKRFTVRAEAGERSGLDLIFTFEFDRPRR